MHDRKIKSLRENRVYMAISRRINYIVAWFIKIYFIILTIYRSSSEEIKSKKLVKIENLISRGRHSVFFYFPSDSRVQTYGRDARNNQEKLPAAETF